MSSTRKSSSVNSLSDTVSSETQLRGGAGYVLCPGEVFGELRYHYVGLRFDSTGRATAGGVSLAAGFRLSL